MIETDWNSYLVSYDDSMLDFFEKRKIYLEYPWRTKGVYKKGEKFRLAKNLLVERYANMPICQKVDYCSWVHFLILEQ